MMKRDRRLKSGEKARRGKQPKTNCDRRSSRQIYKGPSNLAVPAPSSLAIPPSSHSTALARSNPAGSETIRTYTCEEDTAFSFFGCQKGRIGITIWSDCGRSCCGGSLGRSTQIKAIHRPRSWVRFRQMLKSLVYLHVDFDITYWDIKSANILFDSRTHCRLADSGLAKEGDVHKTFNGTIFHRVSEMFQTKL